MSTQRYVQHSSIPMPRIASAANVRHPSLQPEASYQAVGGLPADGGQRAGGSIRDAPTMDLCYLLVTASRIRSDRSTAGVIALLSIGSPL